MKKLILPLLLCAPLRMLSSPALAEEQPFLPYLVIDLEGGAALPGNFLVGGELGPYDLLPSYDTLGWDPYSEDLFAQFGLPMAKDSSKILAGILEKFTASDLTSLQLASICAPSSDDTSRNPLSAITLINRFAMQQQTFTYATGLGTLTTISGGKQSAVYGDAALKPLPIAQANRNDLVMAARNDLRFSAAFDLDRPNQESENNAAIVYALLHGLAPTGVIVLNGYDYHDGNGAAADAKDFEAGKVIGAVAKLAEQLAKPIFIHIITDGGVMARVGRDWNADSGSRSMSIIGTAGPIGTRSFSTLQYGFYTADQTASRQSLYSNTPEAPALATYSEWLRLFTVVKH